MFGIIFNNKELFIFRLVTTYQFDYRFRTKCQQGDSGGQLWYSKRDSVAKKTK